MIISDLEYAAIEPLENTIRLARDKNGNVYIVTNHEEKYTAPFRIAIAARELYNYKMGVYKLSKIELAWLTGIYNFAKGLEIIK